MTARSALIAAMSSMRAVMLLMLLMSHFVVVSMAATHAAATPLGPDDARHLLARTGFSPGITEVADYAQLTREQAADRLLAGTMQKPVARAPASVHEFVSPRRIRAMGDEERRALLQAEREKGVELRGWWLQEMLRTPSPLNERMVLFWHNHFVSSLQKVRSPALMYRQHLLLRRHALGYFGDLLHDIAKDPAMVVYLDSASNRKSQPNENFAREVMELFTLGEGRYSEHDVKEAARAFTGWSIDPDNGEFLFRLPAHDDGLKTVLGRTGAFDGDAVLDILLAQPHTAELIVSKLWREFVSPAPEPAEVARIARMFRENRYNVKVALRALLVSDAFYATRHRGALIKSPVDLIVGTLRQFEFEAADPTPFVFVLRQLGQDLFAPPNVKGWPGGEAWINSSSLLQRKQLLERLFRAQEMRPSPAGMATRPVERVADGKGAGTPRERLARSLADTYFDADAWAARLSANEPAMLRLVLAAAPVHARIASSAASDSLRQLVLDPVYQLK